MAVQAQGGVVRIKFGPTARVSVKVRGSRVFKNPAEAMTYMDEDTLAVVKRLASEYGASKHVRLLLNSTPDKAWDAADRLEKGQKASPSGPLEVFGMTTRKGVYGYAPVGLIEASLDAVDQIRGARAEQHWKQSYGRIEQGKKKLTTQLEALERKYGPQLAGLADKFEAAVSRYEELAGGGGSKVELSVAKKDVERTLAPAIRRKGTLRGAVRTFVQTLIVEPGKEINPHRKVGGRVGGVAKFLGMSEGDVRNAVKLAKRVAIGVVSPLPGLL